MINSRKAYAECAKIRIGPGGIKCACCSPLNGAPRKTKPLMRRMLRRQQKMQLKSVED